MTKEEYILLFEKCASNNCTEEERLLLEEYKDEFSLDLPDTHAIRFPENMQVIEYRVHNKIKKSIKDDKIKKRQTYLIRMAAASIVIALGIGYYLYLHNQYETNIHELQNTASVPSFDNTNIVLTLEDGSTILLDDLNVGSLINQTNAVFTKEESDKLTYRSDDLSNENIVSYNTISIPRGKEYQLTLPDGTNVWLNSESTLRFPVAFSGKERKVELSGEAYFEVAKNKEKPFRVSSKETTIEVLGTQFNVNAYESVTTTLIEGSVKFSSPTDEIVLKPGQTAFEKGQKFSIANADIEAVTAWRNGYFVFRDASIKSIMAEVARRYDIDVEYRQGTENKQFYGKLSRNDELSDLLKNIELTGVVRFKIMPADSGKGRRIIVML